MSPVFDPGHGDDNEDDGGVSVELGVMQWAEVCAALRVYIDHESTKAAPSSRRDALAALREIDRVMLRSDEPSAPDDVLGGES